MLTKEDLIENLTKHIDRPVTEAFVSGFEFSDYRLSYGIHCYTPSTVYFMAIYPAFCLNPKAVFHYNVLKGMVADIDAILDFMSNPKVIAEKARGTGLPPIGKEVQTRDIIAAVFALSRNKESIELFQEQKDFMELGVKHVHLDNYYQDRIRTLCLEYFNHGTLLGVPLSLSFLKGKPEA